MKKPNKHLIALAVVVLPFYLTAILQKVLFTDEQILVEEYLAYYMLLGIAGISVVLLANKFILKNTLHVFRSPDSKVLIELALAGGILSVFYLLKSIEDVSYGMWWSRVVDRTAIDALFSKIFDNTLYSFVIIGPFSWINEGFTALSVGFILINLWALHTKKTWVWISIALTAILFALAQLNNGIPEMINSFLIIAFSAYIFYKYRSILPLLLASILHQSIELASYWYYL